MKSISKKICKLLSLVLIISFILPMMFTVADASSGIKPVSSVIYEDDEKTVSVEISKNLSNNKIYVEQRIYENLAGKYPKVFVEIVRVK